MRRSVDLTLADAVPFGRVLLIVAFVLVLLIGLVVGYFTYLSATATRPTTLGLLEDGTLAPCKESPNSVSSFATDSEHKVRPFDFAGPSDAAWEKLKRTVADVPNAKVISFTDRYLHAEFTSKLFRFVDDVEFVLDSGEHKIHVKSASRVGYSDLGVNRRRVEDIRLRFAATFP